MTESELRDILARKISVLEAGLTLIKKEKYIPSAIGTKSFIDLYAKDSQGHHVLIELKRSDASAREALHEIYKYVEAVKVHLAARDNEIRVLIASTEWRELLVPFSGFVADTKLAVRGLMLTADENAKTVTASPVTPLPILKGRYIAPWHGMKWYTNEKSLNEGITSIESCSHAKGIEDYVVVVLRFHHPVRSERQATMRAMIRQMGGVADDDADKTVRELPSYEYIAYFAMQMLTKEQYLKILGRDPSHIQEICEMVKDIDTEEALYSLHDSVTALEPRPKSDLYEIGNSAKFAALLSGSDCFVHSVLRYGVFARNSLLSDELILSELCGEDGSTGQKLKRTITVSNQPQISSAITDIAACLKENVVWKRNILGALEDIQREFPSAEVDLSIYNPGTGVFTVYFAATRENGFLYVPTYSLFVRAPVPVRMYFGALQADGGALAFKAILGKYYDEDISKLLFTVTWGGRESRDTDIMEDLGCVYRSFRCDVNGEERSYFRLDNERWRACKKTDPLSLFCEYLGQNKTLVQEIVDEIGGRDFGGVFDAGEH